MLSIVKSDRGLLFNPFYPYAKDLLLFSKHPVYKIMYIYIYIYIYTHINIYYYYHYNSNNHNYSKYNYSYKYQKYFCLSKLLE